MEKVRNKQNKMQQKRQLNYMNNLKIKLNLDEELRNIKNKSKQYTIPIFIPHKGCKNECVFCNQRKISGHIKEVTPDQIEHIIETYLEFFTNTNRSIEIAFLVVVLQDLIINYSNSI